MPFRIRGQEQGEREGGRSQGDRVAATNAKDFGGAGTTLGCVPQKRLRDFGQRVRAERAETDKPTNSPRKTGVPK